MNLRIFTISLDSMPFICNHLPVFNRLSVPWLWVAAEGAAMNTESTSWCRPQQPRLSRDGTTAYLDSIKSHPRVKILRQKSWPSKDAMVRACIEGIKEDTILLEADSDELWESWQLEKIVKLFETMPKINAMHFYCRYYLGPNIIATSTDGYGNRKGSEWARAWRLRPYSKVISHEPARFSHCEFPILSRDETKAYKLVFEHYSWYTEQQVSYKANFYGYPSAVAQWKRLQANKVWPVADLSRFLSWVGPNASADLLHR